ncbi:MAG: hypothetical protein GXY32_11490 [Ruminococcaceae bacterium]|nr:hypothetical protein [Oscillospiraceae bacterium]
MPLLLLGIVLLVRWAVAVGKRHVFAIKLALAVVVVVVALLLPLLLGLLPSWVIPNKWSDFSHWANLLAQFSVFIRSLFSLAPAARDMALKGTLVLLLALSAFGSALPLWLGEKCR